MSTANIAPQRTLDQPYHLNASQIARYQQDGFIKLKDVLDAATLAHYGPVIANHVAGKAANLPPLAERGTYGKAFQQIMNLWREGGALRDFVFSKRLARIAAELMQVDGVRLYHDQALFKEPGGGFTPWHADQQYWPLANERCVTVWIPMQETPVDMGPLQFAVGSQRCHFGRDLEISDASEQALAHSLKDLGKDAGPYALGEVSFHAGWTFHRTGPNTSGRMRQVMTVIYMDAQMRLKQPENRNQESDWKGWCPGARVGEVIASELNPVLWQRT